ncbi:MAG: SCO family protein [Bacteroidetes bacterium]|nr:SCO family protein [Bacteroidota bacterium]
MNKPNWKSILIPFTILLFPVILWLVLVTGHNHFQTLPIIGPVDVNANGDTTYHTIPPFSFTNQDGKTITDKDLENQIYVASFFFASCKSVCPKLNEEMGRVQYAFKDYKNSTFSLYRRPGTRFSCCLKSLRGKYACRQFNVVVSYR